MDFYSQNLMYEFHAKDLSQIDALRQIADHTVKEIKSTAGWDTDVQVNIEPEAKDKKLFSVSMSVFGLGEPVVVKKSGKHVMALIRKVRKGVLRQIHKISKRRVTARKRFALKEQMVS